MRIAGEEQKIIKKYVSLGLHVILSVTILVLLIFYIGKNIVISILILLSGLIILYAGIKAVELKTVLASNFIMLGFLFYLGSASLNVFAVISCLVFLYGVLKFSNSYDKKKQNVDVILGYSSIFILAANLIFYLAHHFSFLIFR